MSLTRQIAHNTAYQIVGKVVSVAFSLFGIALLTRYLGTAGYGQYTEAVIFAQFFGTLADFGLYIVTVKRISEAGVDEPRIFANILSLRLVSAIFFVGLAPLIVLFFPYPAIVKWGVCITTVSTLFISISQILSGLFQKHLRMWWAAQAEMFGRFISLGFIIALIALKASLLWLLTAFVVSSGIQLLVQFLYGRRLVPIRLRADFDVWRSVLRESWPVAVTIALNLIYFRADTIILSIYRPEATVGLYGASYKVLEILVSFPAMFAGLVLPVITRHLSEGNHDGFRTAMQRSVDFLALLAFPMVASIFLLAHPIMALASGEAFRESGSILRVLIFATGIIFFGNLFGNTIVALGKQRLMMKYYAVVAISSLLGYFWLIPRYAVWGASGMTVATELAITLTSFLVVWQTTRLRLSFRHIGKTFLAALVVVAALFPFRDGSLLISVPLGIAVYVAAAFGLRCVTVQEIKEIFLRSS